MLESLARVSHRPGARVHASPGGPSLSSAGSPEPHPISGSCLTGVGNQAQGEAVLACGLSTPAQPGLCLPAVPCQASCSRSLGLGVSKGSKDARALGLCFREETKIMGAQPANVDHEFPSSLTPLPSPGRASGLPGLTLAGFPSSQCPSQPQSVPGRETPAPTWQEQL